MIVAGLVLMDDCVEWCGEQVVSGSDLATYVPLANCWRKAEIGVSRSEARSSARKTPAYSRAFNERKLGAHPLKVI